MKVVRNFLVGSFTVYSLYQVNDASSKEGGVILGCSRVSWLVIGLYGDNRLFPVAPIILQNFPKI